MLRLKRVGGSKMFEAKSSSQSSTNPNADTIELSITEDGISLRCRDLRISLPVNKDKKIMIEQDK